jgi:tRNA nucleotidyltransferase/poly(A) polymerase
MKQFKQYTKYLKEDIDLAKHSSSKELVTAIEVLQKLEKHGDALIVGGAVRDILMEKIPHDIDIATNVPMEIIDRIFPSQHDIGKNKDFGISVIEYKGFSFEVAQFRSDSDNYLNGRRPEFVKYISSFKDDSLRRDFTINSLGMDSHGRIIDYTNGIDDISAKIIKAVGDPNKRFEEDYLRMLRAIRFASRLGFHLDNETKSAIQKSASKVSALSPERIYQELVKMAAQRGDKFADALKLLKDTGLLQHILPELVETEFLMHDPKYHPENEDGKHSVWAHILSAVKASELENPIINLAILFHDIGKIKSYENVDGKISYIDHAKKGLEVINQIADRLKMDNKTRDALLFAAENHMKMHELLSMSKSKVLKLIDNQNWDTLYNVALADEKARLHLFDKERWQEMISYIEDLSRDREANLSKENLKKLVNGKLVMSLRNIKPSKEVGDIINQTLSWIIDNDIDTKDTKKIEDYILSI